jgi:uncharacterized membrane protein
MNPAEPPSSGDPASSTPTVKAEKAGSQPQGRIVRTIRQVVRSEVRSELRVWSGPLPPPEILAQYNEVFPGCGKVIVDMAQKEQEHRHTSEDRGAEADIKLASRGQLIGGALAIVAVLGAIYLLAHDKSITGLAVLGTVVVAFGGAFVYDRYQRAQSANLEEKDTGKDTQELEAIFPELIEPPQTEPKE